MRVQSTSRHFCMLASLTCLQGSTSAGSHRLEADLGEISEHTHMIDASVHSFVPVHLTQHTKRPPDLLVSLLTTPSLSYKVTSDKFSVGEKYAMSEYGSVTCPETAAPIQNLEDCMNFFKDIKNFIPKAISRSKDWEKLVVTKLSSPRPDEPGGCFIRQSGPLNSFVGGFNEKIGTAVRGAFVICLKTERYVKTQEKECGAAGTPILSEKACQDAVRVMLPDVPPVVTVKESDSATGRPRGCSLSSDDTSPMFYNPVRTPLQSEGLSDNLLVSGIQLICAEHVAPLKASVVKSSSVQQHTACWAVALSFLAAVKVLH